MSFRKYFPATLALLLALAESYIAWGFYSTNLEMPQASAFGAATIGFSTVAALLSFAAFIALIPSVKNLVVEKIFSKKSYKASMIILLVISLSFAGVALYSGFTDYTQFQASMS